MEGFQMVEIHHYLRSPIQLYYSISKPNTSITFYVLTMLQKSLTLLL